MKSKFIAACFFALFFQFANAQCERAYFVLSPSLVKYSGGSLGVSAEAGLLPVAAKSFVTLKAGFWSQPYSYAAINYKGQAEEWTGSRGNAFIGLKLNHVPQAYESEPRKWAFGAAAGVYLQEKKNSQPAAEFSSAYIIRMPQGNYNGGIGYLKIEGACLLTPTTIRPGLSVGILMLL